MEYEEVLQRFKVVKKGYSSAQCICPAHGDNHASLTISKADNGNTLIHCHAGCSVESVLESAGLKQSDLFVSKGARWQSYLEKHTKLPLQSRYDYKDYQGKYVFTRFRLFPKTFRIGIFDAAGERITLGLNGKERKKMDAYYSVSSLNEIKSSIASGENIYITEGEKDAQTLHNNGLVAVTFGSSEDLSSNIDVFLKDANLILVSDYDVVGYKLMTEIKRICEHSTKSIKIIFPCIDEIHSDVTDYFDSGHTKGELLDMILSQSIDKAFIDTLYSRQQSYDEKHGKKTGNKPEEKQNILSDRQTAHITMLQNLKPEVNITLDDKGNGYLFSCIFSDEIRWNVTAKEFYAYDGIIWQQDNGGMLAAKCAKELSDALYIYAVNINDEKLKEVYKAHINKLGQYRYRKTMLEDSRDCNFISADNLDKNDYLLNVQNGVIDLKTFEFKEHDPELLLSKVCNATYIQGAKSEVWENFINEIMQGDNDKIEYLQKALGYSLTGDTREESCYILYGRTTRNGKSTLVETIAYMLGNTQGYSMSMKPETLATKQNTDSRQASGDIARLKDCRFLNASEPPKRMMFDVGLLKSLLGRDTITARHLHQSEIEFTPKFKLFMNTNFLPLITDSTLFNSGRINVITFDKHFSESEQDKTLKNRLREPENISGILNWCLDGLKKYYKDGLIPPKAVKAATNEYAKDSDKLGNFIAERLEESEKNSAASDIYKEYQSWCKDNGYGIENKGNFYAELKTKGIYAAKGTVFGKTVRNIVSGYVISSEFREIPDSNVPFLN